MSRWSPCKRHEFIRRLRKIGFEGPFSGTEHQFMLFLNNRLTIPSNKEFSVPQLKMMLNEVEGIIEREITLDEWEKDLK